MAKLAEKRDELIKELGFTCTYCDGSGGRQISEDEVEQCQYCDEIKPKVADFILRREEALLAEIEKPLKQECVVQYQGAHALQRIKEALQIIEKARKG